MEEMLSRTLVIREPAALKYYDMSLAERVDTVSAYAKADLAELHDASRLKEIFATTLLHVIRTEVVESVYPKIPSTEHSTFGRRNETYRGWPGCVNLTPIKLSRFSDRFSTMEYLLFNVLNNKAIGPVSSTVDVIKEFFQFILDKNLSANSKLIEFMMKNPDKMDEHLVKVVPDMERVCNTIFRFDISARASNIHMILLALNVCAALLLSPVLHTSDDDFKSVSDTLRIGLKAIKKLHWCSTDGLKAINNGMFGLLTVLVIFYPHIMIPGSQEFYGCVIEILNCSTLRLPKTKGTFLNMFAAYAENYPNKIREIGKIELWSVADDKYRTYEEEIIYGIFMTIKENEEFYQKSKTPRCPLTDFEAIQKVVSCWGRFSKIIDNKNIWKFVLHYLKLFSNVSWGLQVATIRILSVLGEVCSSQIMDSIDMIMELLRLSFSEGSKLPLKLAACQALIQLSIDLGSEFILKWRNEFFLSTLLCYIEDEATSWFHKSMALRTLEIYSKDCPMPALTLHWPDLLDAIFYLIYAAYTENLYAVRDEVIQAGIKCCFNLMRTAKRYLTIPQIRFFRKVIHENFDYFIRLTRYNVIDNCQHMHHVLFNALLQALEFHDHLKLRTNIVECLQRMFDEKFSDIFHKEYIKITSPMTHRTFPCAAVYVLANLSQEHLQLCQTAIMPQMNNIVRLANIEYLEIIREYSLVHFTSRTEIKMKHYPAFEECTMGKLYACKALLHFAKSKNNFFIEIGLCKVIDAMHINLVDMMCSTTQETAAEALPVLLKMLKIENREQFLTIYPSMLSSFMDVIKRQTFPMKLLVLLRNVIDLYKLADKIHVNEPLTTKIKNLILSKIELIPEFIEAHRFTQSVSVSTKSKAAMMAEISQKIMELRCDAAGLLPC